MAAGIVALVLTVAGFESFSVHSLPYWETVTAFLADRDTLIVAQTAFGFLHGQPFRIDPAEAPIQP
ncbi:hypothetical protein N658DRAFT_491395 [Parathielavia hyrcaniae]|uniref:Uncharacterized protein n=1 Tax=Parathielavia hyrcaniae TaxID=113614 RepID=A0AAN6T6N4_9PEZI|nr:hypothetical protein N658DRAFT_491395 [Parathielavia hyrcaniae]